MIDLGGPLGDNHKPEGSGNIFWLETFTCVNGGQLFFAHHFFRAAQFTKKNCLLA